MQISDLSEAELAELTKRFDAVRDPNNPYQVIADNLVEEIKQLYFLELEEAKTAPIPVATPKSVKGGE